jgi:aryl-alcohol dehydrogenase-like predicted oxidoreductase
MSSSSHATYTRLGCGLIRLGRSWGAWEQPPLSSQQARAFLETAIEMGIDFFDTAPAYGSSEALLGEMCGSLADTQRECLQIATKVGEHWVAEDQTTVVDHSDQAVRRSIEQSLQRLGRIDVLQIHKASVELLRSDAFPSLIETLREYKIPALGVSLSDMETFKLAHASQEFLYYQFPFNQASAGLGEVLDMLVQEHAQPLINRPMAMGKLVQGHTDVNRTRLLRDAFSFILPQMHTGVILTGTGDPHHLRENLRAFEEASQSR